MQHKLWQSKHGNTDYYNLCNTNNVITNKTVRPKVEVATVCHPSDVFF